MNGLLQDKVLLITGSSGIAAETIRQAVKQSAKIFFCSWDEASCIALKEEFAETDCVDYLAGDLVDPLVAPQIVAGCLERFGKISALFNVAGISGRRYGDGPVHECTENGWQYTMQANATTQYRMCKEVISYMLTAAVDEHGIRGTILNMTSILGIDPEPDHFSTVAYASSKGAIVSMTRSIAATYSNKGIRANVIAPGLTGTPMSQRATDDAAIKKFIAHKQPLTSGVIEAADIARIALFLLSDQSWIITGQTVVADGGWSIS